MLQKDVYTQENNSQLKIALSYSTQVNALSYSPSLSYYTSHLYI